MNYGSLTAYKPREFVELYSEAQKEKQKTVPLKIKVTHCYYKGLGLAMIN